MAESYVPVVSGLLPPTRLPHSWLKMECAKQQTAGQLDLLLDRGYGSGGSNVFWQMRLRIFFFRRICQCYPAVKVWKSSGTESLFPELIFHAGSDLKPWLNKFLSSCMRQFQLSKIRRRALVVAIPKPSKPLGDPKSYRSISLLSVFFKILERLVYFCVEQFLPRELAGFRREKLNVSQVTFLTQKIEDSFLDNKKAGATFINLIAAYNTVWHHGLTCGNSLVIEVLPSTPVP